MKFDLPFFVAIKLCIFLKCNIKNSVAVGMWFNIVLLDTLHRKEI